MSLAELFEPVSGVDDLLMTSANTWSGLTIWIPPDNHKMGKRLVFNDEGKLIAKSGQKTPPRLWKEALEVDAPDFDALQRVVEFCDENNAVLAHGGLTEDSKRSRLRKLGVRRNGLKGTVTDRPTRVLLLDLDNLPPIVNVREKSAEDIHAAVLPLLPPEFRVAKCLLHYSTGHGSSETVVKIHLVYLLSRPLNTAERKRVLAEALTFKARGVALRPIDPLPLGEAHFVNITPPETINPPEGYSKTRWFFINQGEDFVVVPTTSEIQRREKSGAEFKLVNGGGANGLRPSSGQGLGQKPTGLSDWKDLIWASVAEGRTGHTAMRYGAWAYVSAFGPNADREPFLAEYAAAIASLNLEPSEAERIIADEERHYNWICETLRLHTEPEIVAIKRPNVCSQEEGRKIVRGEIRRLTAQAIRHQRNYSRWSRARQTLTALQKEIDGGNEALRPIAGAIGVAAGAAEYIFGSEVAWIPKGYSAAFPASVVQGSVALGKTESVIEVLSGVRRWGLKTVFAVADHDLLGDIFKRIGDSFDKIAWSDKNPRPQVAVWRGEGAIDPDQQDGVTICPRSVERGAARAIGAQADRLCSRGRGKKKRLCPHHPENLDRVGPGCGFIRQQAAVRDADIILIAGSAFFERKPNEWIARPPEKISVEGVEIKIQLPQVDLVISDEPRWMQLVAGVDQDDPDDAAAPPSKMEMQADEISGLWIDDAPEDVAERLDAVRVEIGADGALGERIASAPLRAKLETLKAATRRLVDEIKATERGRRLTYGQLEKIVGDAGLLADGRAAELVDAAYSLLAGVEVAPEEDLNQWLAEEGALLRSWNERLIFLARAFGAIQKAFSRHNNAPEKEETGFLVVDEIGKRRQRGLGLKIRLAHKVHPSWREGAGLILDATHEPLIADEFWPNLPKAKIIEVAQPKDAAVVRQVFDESFSLTQIDETIKSPAKLKRLATYIEIEAAIVRGRGESGIDLLVILPKKLLPALLRHWRQKPPLGVEFTTWGKVRGQDRWRGVAGLIAISRLLPPAESLADLESILTGKPSALDEKEFKMVPAHWLQNENRGKAWQLPDKRPTLLSPVAEALREAACEAELKQGIGRARLNIRPGAKVRVTVLASTPVPALCVDQLVKADSILSAHPAAIAAARGLALPASAKGGREIMARVLGVNDEALKWQLRQEKNSALKGENPLYSILYKGFSPLREDEKTAPAGAKKAASKRQGISGEKASALRLENPLYSILYKENSNLRADRKLELIGSGNPVFDEVAAAALWLPIRLKLKAKDRYSTPALVRANSLEKARELLIEILGIAPAALTYWRL